MSKCRYDLSENCNNIDYCVLDKIRAEIQDTGAYEQEVNGKTEFVEGITYCLGIIDKYTAKKVPRLEQQPKIGHWIKMPLIEAGQTYSHQCSVCGRRILVTDVGLSEFPYCHCGAKMQEESKEEDGNK